MIIILYILIGILVIGLLWFIASYNGFISLKNQVEEAWADIDVQLKRRYDLIPNLIETVKGYATHESKTLEAVIAARNNAMSQEKVAAGAMVGAGVAAGSETANFAAMAQAENALSGTLKNLFALSENYPDLKANTNFLELQRELSDTENKIQAARRFYNGNVRDYNIKRESFPSNIIANLFNFGKKELFNLEGAPEERENVKVSF